LENLLLEAVIAKAWVSEVYRWVNLLGHRVGGGIAFAEDHDMSLYYKRAKTVEIALGDAVYYEEVVTREMSL